LPDVRATARAAASLVMPLAYLALTLLVFWHLWTPIEGAAFTWLGETRHAPWGGLSFFERAWSRGQLGLWNPHDQGGVPVYADARAGLLYPLHWLLVWLGAIAFEGGHGLVEARAIVHGVLGAAGVHVLLVRRGAPPQGAYLGGAIVVLTGPAILDPTSAASASAMWIPWLLVATDGLAAAPSYRRAVVCGAVWAMCALAGAPAVALAALLLAAPYLAVAMWGRRGEAVPMVAVAAGIALLAAAPLWVAAFDLVAHAAGDGARVGASTSLASAATILVPGPSPAVYAGLLPLLALGALALAHRDRRGRVLAVFTVVGLASALAAPQVVGRALGWLALSPGLVSRLELYPVAVALAAGAGLGLGALLEVRDDARRRALARWITRLGLVACFALGLAAVAAAALGEAQDALRGRAAWALASAAGATALLRGILLSEGRGRAACAWAAVALVAMDLWGGNIEARRAHLEAKPQPRHEQVVAELEGVTDGRYRIFDQNPLHERRGVRWGIRDLSGSGDDPRALSRYARYRHQALAEPALLGHANVRYVLGPYDGATEANAGGEGVVVSRQKRGLYEVGPVAPAVYYVARPQRVSDVNEALGALADLTPGRGAVVEGEVPPGPEGAPPVAGLVTLREGGRLVAEITTPGPGVVIIAEAYHPRWTAKVGGEPAAIMPANGMFRGVAISGAGHHIIEMRLVPRLYLGSLVGFAAAFALIGWVVGSALWRRARRR
jgi:hypothetical protein